jgi:chemotaxis methyl-accepting protein methylase
MENIQAAGAGKNGHSRSTWKKADANLTWFFRNPWQFRQLGVRLAALFQELKTIRILSVGASTGQEAISALITTLNILEEISTQKPGFAAPPVEVIALEINQQNIDVFRENQYELCPAKIPELRKNWRKYFDPLPGHVYGDHALRIYRVSLKAEYHQRIRYVKTDVRNADRLRQFKQEFGERTFAAIFFNNVSDQMSSRSARRVKQILEGEFLSPGGILLSTG